MRFIIVALALMAMFSTASVFTPIGNGFCRDANLDHVWSVDEYCVDSRSKCEEKCPEADCACFAYSEPSVDDFGGCRTKGQYRCVTYTGSGEATKTLDYEGYISYVRVAAADACIQDSFISDKCHNHIVWALDNGISDTENRDELYSHLDKMTHDLKWESATFMDVQLNFFCNEYHMNNNPSSDCQYLLPSCDQNGKARQCYSVQSTRAWGDSTCYHIYEEKPVPASLTAGCNCGPAETPCSTDEYCWESTSECKSEPLFGNCFGGAVQDAASNCCLDSECPVTCLSRESAAGACTCSDCNRTPCDDSYTTAVTGNGESLCNCYGKTTADGYAAGKFCYDGNFHDSGITDFCNGKDLCVNGGTCESGNDYPEGFKCNCLSTDQALYDQRNCFYRGSGGGSGGSGKAYGPARPIGDGFCRDANLDQIWKADEYCVDSRSKCEEKCADCACFSYSEPTLDNSSGCRAKGKYRCVTYTGSGEATQTETLGFDGYISYVRVAAAAPVVKTYVPLGIGYCRDANFDQIWKADDYCVDSRSKCEEKCVDCACISYSEPSVDDFGGCRTKGQYRCVAYRGSGEATQTKTLGADGYISYVRSGAPAPIPPCIDGVNCIAEANKDKCRIDLGYDRIFEDKAGEVRALGAVVTCGRLCKGYYGFGLQHPLMREGKLFVECWCGTYPEWVDRINYDVIHNLASCHKIYGGFFRMRIYRNAFGHGKMHDKTTIKSHSLDEIHYGPNPTWKQLPGYQCGGLELLDWRDGKDSLNGNGETTMDTCKTKCLNDGACKGFEVDTSSGQCDYYKETLNPVPSAGHDCWRKDGWRVHEFKAGCYKDMNNRLFPHRSPIYFMNLDECNRHCVNMRKNSRKNSVDDWVFALEWGIECWCGDSEDNPTQYGKATACSMYGDGGFWEVNVYHLGGRQGETVLANACTPSATVAVANNCWCDPGSQTEDCDAGKYCHPDTYVCSSNPPDSACASACPANWVWDKYEMLCWTPHNHQANKCYVAAGNCRHPKKKDYQNSNKERAVKDCTSV